MLCDDFCRNSCAYHINEFATGLLLKTTSLAFATALTLTAFVSAPVLACAQLRDGPKGIVTQVVDGDTLFLDNGLKVRLIGIQAPKLALGREGFEEWPLADEAKTALEKLVLGKFMQLRYGDVERDRHDRVLAHGFVDDDVWVQQAMLKNGLARVYSFPDNRFCLDELYASEAQARSKRIGIWTHRFYGLRRADKPQDLLALEGRYELVEGRVLQAEMAGSRIYLNFGRVWREDFTIVIERSAQRIFDDADADPLQLSDMLIRVRGWVDVNDGPRITITHPEQIEVLATK